jgi:large subunit ribosomal protein L18
MSIRNIKGTSSKPRISVYRSNTSIYAQVIDDSKSITLASASLKDVNDKQKTNYNVSKSKSVGLLLGQRAIAAGISRVVFDRSVYKFHGNVKALADGAREAGLIF